MTPNFDYEMEDDGVEEGIIINRVRQNNISFAEETIIFSDSPKMLKTRRESNSTLQLTI